MPKNKSSGSRQDPARVAHANPRATRQNDALEEVMPCLGDTSLPDAFFKRLYYHVTDLVRKGAFCCDAYGHIYFANAVAKQILSSLGAEKDALFRRVHQDLETLQGTEILFTAKKDAYFVKARRILEQEHLYLVCLEPAPAGGEMAQRLKEAEEMRRELEVIFSSTHDGIFVADGKGVALKYNDAYSRITGINAEELMGLSMEEIVERGYISESATLKAIQKRQQVTTMPRLKSGNKALITSIPVFDEQGEIIRVIASIRDITELISLKEQLEEVTQRSERYHDEIVLLRKQNIQVEGVIATSAVMQDVLATALKVAETDATVLLTGDSGVGKEVLAHTIHNRSARKNASFIKVNCGAIPAPLFESELFGYAKGAFTSAAQGGKRGLFSLAEEGTLFLDEIGELSLEMQAKLLGFLQDKRFTPVGGVNEISLNARVIAATNRNLEEMIEEGTFRKDLYYRLKVISLHLPLLRERQEDILPFIHFFLQKFNIKYRSNTRVNHAFVRHLQQYAWPGNVRELGNLMEQMVILHPHEEVTPKMLPEAMHHVCPPDCLAPEAMQSLPDMIHQLEHDVFSALIAQGYSSYDMAKKLGINQSTVVRKLHKLRLNTT